jgi:acyl-CoA reductase-like NAD-dependent aldehyde dehydrogenase
MTPPEGGRIIWRIGDLILEHLDELAQLESLDNGKPAPARRGPRLGHRATAAAGGYGAGTMTDPQQVYGARLLTTSKLRRPGLGTRPGARECSSRRTAPSQAYALPTSAQ